MCVCVLGELESKAKVADVRLVSSEAMLVICITRSAIYAHCCLRIEPFLAVGGIFTRTWGCWCVRFEQTR